MKKSTVILIIFAAAMLYVVGLGETLFNSKGEPREAIVAVSMLDSGNWILPESYGADIPYKPPFLAWLIAIFSLIFNGGVVSEFTSRLPSALAAISILVVGWRVVANRQGRDQAWTMLIVTMTSFEFFRAAIACRVDMVLTAAMVGGVYALYTMKGHPWRCVAAIGLLSAAVLTKGPIGAALPLLAMFIFFICRGENILKTMLKLAVIGIGSLIIPAAWYYSAAQIGGQEFIKLAMEENIGRLTGTMSYESHLNPWWYNFVTILWGMLPWTVPVAIGLCYRRIRGMIRLPRRTDDFSLLATVVTLTVIIFYCIPASKRSVYLLPCYPFLAYGAAWVLIKLKGTKLMGATSIVLAVVAIAAPIAMTIVGYVSDKVNPPYGFGWVGIITPALFSIWWLMTRSENTRTLTSACVFVYVLYFAYASGFAPMILNPKSDHALVSEIERSAGQKTPIVSVIPEDRLIRYYTINFYMNDRLHSATSLDSVAPNAVILASPMAMEQARDFDFSRYSVTTLTKRSCDNRLPIVMLTPERVK